MSRDHGKKNTSRQASRQALKDHGFDLLRVQFWTSVQKNRVSKRVRKWIRLKLKVDKYSGTVITYEEAFDHSDAGVGLCLLLPKAFVLQKFVDMSLNKNISVHFVFTCPSNTSEFEASAWQYNLLHDKVQHIGFMQNLGITVCSNSNQEKYIIACQVEPNAEHCQVSWTQSGKTLEYVFPRTVVERCHTVSELQNISVVNCIDFRRPNGCHRISERIDVTSLTVQIANDSLADIELVEKSIQPTIDAAWSHGLAECQVKHFILY